MRGGTRMLFSGSTVTEARWGQTPPAATRKPALPATETTVLLVASGCPPPIKEQRVFIYHQYHPVSVRVGQQAERGGI